jgi:hypothetical protein
LLGRGKDRRVLGFSVEKALTTNAKIVVPSNTELINVIGELAGIVPVPRNVEPK